MGYNDIYMLCMLSIVIIMMIGMFIYDLIKDKSIYKFSVLAQDTLWLVGVSVHNFLADECCADFSCCEKDMKLSFKERLIIYKKKYGGKNK